ncbi:O-acyltransferase protein [Spatholobus suberectus]|nr:O-acyltransferase protein [Spatholobus suberectus]
MVQARNPQNGESSTPLVVQGEGLTNDGLIPHIFSSMPALNDAASYLAQTTSYLTGCFSDYSVEHSPRRSGASVPHAQELVDFPSAETDTSSSTEIDHISSNRIHLTSVESSIASTSAPPHMHDEITRTSGGDLLQNSNALVESNRTGQSGISIFQSLIDRARRTVRGSADDIGWLQRDPGMPPVEDGTERFLEILDSIKHGVHKLPNSVVYLLIPGLFSNHGPLYFVNTKVSFSKMGLACHIAKIHSEASVEKNARELKEYIEEIYWGSKKRVLLLGHSKGGVDAAAALSLYWSDLKDKVAGLALAQSPYGGTPIASDLLREGQLGDYVNLRKLTEILICKVIKGDMRALEDLTYERRREFLKEHHLPKEVPIVSFRTEAGISPAVLATLSHVAHAELPVVAPAGEPTKLPVVVPLGAAMAACAQLLQLRYGEKSDGLVTCRDAEVPGSVVVRPKRKLDHAWMVYSSLNDDPSEGDASQVCEALLTLLVEIGQKKMHELAMKDE